MSFTFSELKFSKTENHDVSLFGAFPRGDTLRLELLAPRRAGVLGVQFVIHADALDFPDDEEKTIPLLWSELREGNDVYTAELDLASLTGEEPGRRLFYYNYRITTEEGTAVFGGEKSTELLPVEQAGDRQLLLYDDDFAACPGIGEGIIYHIFVDRFRKSGRCEPRRGAVIDPDWDNGIPQYPEKPGDKFSNNVFFGGDIYGITEKLDYIASLGTKTIYLSPIFEAASNHKYDTGDYLRVDSMFGGDEALGELCEKAKKHGIRVILDGVFNHTGSDSVYFNREGNYPGEGAFGSKNSPYYDWYTFKSWPEDYECWWGVDILPRVRSANPSYTSFVFNEVIPKWMKEGVGGWRLDVADELSDEFLLALRRTVKSFDPEAPVIGEVWEDATNKISYGKRRLYMRGGELDSVMNYPLREAVIGFIRYGRHEKLRETVDGQYRRYPKCASDSMMNFLSTHDTQRILTVLGGQEQGEMTNRELSTLHMSPVCRKRAVRLLKLAYALIVAMPGAPCVFYGDEAGLEGYRDPFCRRPFPWNNIEKELLKWYRRLGAVRRETPLLHSGFYRTVFSSEELFVLRRDPCDGKGDYLLAVINRSERTVPLAFSLDVRELISGESADSFDLEPLSAAYFLLPQSEKIDSESFI